MDNSIATALFVSVVGAAIGALLTWLLPELRKSPQQRRLEKVQKASLENVAHSQVLQNASGKQQNIWINYVASSTSANSQYIATGQGEPIVPDVQRWLQAARTEDPRPITRFSGEVPISNMRDSEAEVFYPAGFLRPPGLQVSPEGGTARLTIEQRADGFKVKAIDYRANSDRGVSLKWVAEGELASSTTAPAV